MERGECDKIDGSRKGIEFSVKQFSSTDWTPSLYLYPNVSNKRNLDNIRGFNTYREEIIHQSITSIHLKVSNFSLNDPVQFCWFQAANFKSKSTGFRDMWALDDVDILLSNGNKSNCLVSVSFTNIETR